jgi:hypothetical protein
MCDSSIEDAGLARSALLRVPKHPRLSPLLSEENHLSDNSLDNVAMNVILESSDTSDDSIDLEYLETLRRRRLRRRCDTYHYSGDIRKSINNTFEDQMLNWSSLPDDVYKQRWINEFRMTEEVFTELLHLVERHVHPTVPRKKNLRVYTVRDKLFVTLNFLSHCPTLRQLSQKWGMPPDSIRMICLHPTVRALAHIFTKDGDSKHILWPSTPAAQQEVMNGFKRKYQLPGCLGAIDGSLIPQRKPTKEQANQDADSYYGYKGGIASLLLAVCDADLKFTYVSTGAPACVGDAGLFGRSQLKIRLDEGMLKAVTVPLTMHDGSVHQIHPYLVGDAAFPLGQHMLKVYDQAIPGSAEAKLNKRLLRARCGIERSFGLLKGRFVFCAKNSFWGDLDFTRAALQACCGLHNFLIDRTVDMPEVDDVPEEALPMPNEMAAPGGCGAEVRDLLASWVQEN